MQKQIEAKINREQFVSIKRSGDIHPLARLITNSQGVSLVSVLVSMGILTVVFMSGLQMTQRVTTGQSQIEVQNRAALLRYSVLQTVLFDPTWDYIVRNSNISCALPHDTGCDAEYTLSTDTDTTNDSDLAIVFGGKNSSALLSAGSIYALDSVTSNSGVDINLSNTRLHNVDSVSNLGSCNINDANPSNQRNCVFYVRTRWNPVGCDGISTCYPNQVEVNFTLELNPNFTLANNQNQMGAFNSERYSFSIVRQVFADQYFQVSQRSSANEVGLAVGDNLRRLNTIDYDIGGNVASVGPNSVTIEAGVYRCRLSVPGCGTGSHNVALINQSNGNDILIQGTPSFAFAEPLKDDEFCNRAFAEGKFVLNAQSTLAIRHSITTTATYTGGRSLQTGSATDRYSVMSCLKEN